MPLRDEIFQAILSRYGSLEQPNFAFAERAVSDNAWGSLVGDLRARLHVDDVTDLNSDVSRVLTIGEGAMEATLELSFVGPYGVYFGQRGKFVFMDEPECAPTADDRFVLETCAAHGVAMLGEKVLNVPVPLVLFDTAPERVRVYQALFADVDFIPGEYSRWMKETGGNE